MMELSYRRHRFPPVVIQHAVWLYLRFTLSYRDVEDRLAERGLDISYETVRSWVLKFGPVIARRLRPGPPSPERAMASRRDGCSGRWQADVPLACRRSRRRGSRHAGATPPRHPSGVAADAQASQKARVYAEIASDRQAALLCFRVPALTTELSA